MILRWLCGLLAAGACGVGSRARAIETAQAEGQPLAANVERLASALDFLGAPLPAELRQELARAGQERDGGKLQALLDGSVLLSVHINPEERVSVTRGPAAATLQQGGYTPFILKVVNDGACTGRLHLRSPQAGPVYAGMSPLTAGRMKQLHLLENQNVAGDKGRFLELEVFTAPPMTESLSGAAVEYAIALIYSKESGQREAVISCDVGQGTQDLGFRAEQPVLFRVRPAIPVRLRIRDTDGSPTVARLQFVDAEGRVYPPQANRLAPDLFFQKQIYRGDGETVLLPPGTFTMRYGRGPEYRWSARQVKVPAPEIRVDLERWIDPAAHGYYSGDIHIHAAGCAHYSCPTEGMNPSDMFRQVKGEGLNLGSILTWQGGFDYQHRFFSAEADRLSEPLTQIKYDIEVSGFGSQWLGHLVLLNLRDEIYPGAAGTDKWPTWTLPVLRWARAQGAWGGYAHSGSGMGVEPAAAAKRLLQQLDADGDQALDSREAARGLLPEAFAAIDVNRDGRLNEQELEASEARAADLLPNRAIPELDGVGDQEIFVTAPLGACAFVGVMDTPRMREWNAWYHLLNCGFLIKAAGETDFPCMSGTRVGQGRTYVRLPQGAPLSYARWCAGMVAGRSYVSDGYAHALDFAVDGRPAGEEVRLGSPGAVTVHAVVAFSPETPLEAAYGTVVPTGGRHWMGDTVYKRDWKAEDPIAGRGMRLVEVVVNGDVADRKEVPADGKEHAVDFKVPIERSSWIAVRQFPELHTNPVNVLVAGRPIRASRASAEWASACVDQLWRSRNSRIAEAERPAAKEAYEQAKRVYRQIAAEAPPGS